MTASTFVTSEQNLAGRARCPRCGYDLRGAIGTWADQCPLVGTCAECGLQFVWAEILHPEKYEPPWCVEFAPRWRQVLRACVRTFARSFWPFGFWRALKMSMSIRWRRIFAYLVLLAIPFLIGYVAIQTVAVVRMRLTTNQLFDEQFQALPQAIVRLQQQTQSPEFLRADPLAQQHLTARIQQMQLVTRSSYSIDYSFPAALADAIFLPFSDNFRGTITTPWGRVPSPPPSELRQPRAVWGGGLVSGSPGFEQFIASFIGLGFGLWVYLLFPLTFVLLPVSRRRAKVRWAHVFRVCCYGFFIPSTVLCTLVLVLAIGDAFSAVPGSLLVTGATVASYCLLPMLMVWWAAAIKFYLHIPHAWSVAILLIIMLSLIYLGALWAAVPDIAVNLW